MAIFYVDPINGNNANDGLSFATAWNNLGTILATRITPGDEFRFVKTPDPTSLGQNAKFTSRQYVGSDALLTNFTSTNTSPIQVTKANHGYLTGDLVLIYNHVVNTNANGYWKITKVSDNVFSLDDSVGNGVGTSSGSVVRMNNRVIELTNAVTEDVSICNANWTPGTNVTSALLSATDWKCGIGCVRIVTAAGAGANQILAKEGLSIQKDLSGYQQISFWLKSSIAQTAGALELRLYSDAACTNLVETLPLPAITVANVWYQFALDKGSALSTTVQGVALYTTVAQASRTILIDNILACKAKSANDSLTLKSLVGKNVVNEYADHVFAGLQAIVGKYLIIDADVSNLANAGQGYYGVNETVPIYKREAIDIYLASTSSSYLSITEKGTTTNHYKISGGWNKDTGLQDGLSIFNGNGVGNGAAFSSRSYIDIDNFQFTRWGYGHRYNSALGIMSRIYATNCNNVGIQLEYASESVTDIIALYGGYTGVTISSTVGMNIDGIISNSNKQQGILNSAANHNISNVSANNNFSIGFSNSNVTPPQNIVSLCYNKEGLYITGYNMVLPYIEQIKYNEVGVSFLNAGLIRFIEINLLTDNSVAVQCGTRVENIDFDSINTFSDNYNMLYIATAIYGLKFKYIGACVNNTTIYNINSSAVGVDIYFYNVNFESATPYEIRSTSYSQVYFINCLNILPIKDNTFVQSNYNESRHFYHNFNQDVNDHQILANGGIIISDQVERHTAAGISWAMYVNQIWRDINTPLTLTLRRVRVKAGELVLVSAWMKKSHATDIGARLIVKAYKTAGIINDISVIALNNTDWQIVSFQMLATVTEVIDIEVDAYWVANLADECVWVDDVFVTKL